MLKKFIKKLRARPEHVRTTYALIMSLSVTIVIISFWLVSYIDKSNEILNRKSDHNPSDFIDKVGEQVGGSYEQMKDRFNFTKIFNNTDGTTNEGSTTDDTDSSDNFATTTESSIGSQSVKYNPQSASLDDILNTKKQDNQGNNATTSN